MASTKSKSPAHVFPPSVWSAVDQLDLRRQLSTVGVISISLPSSSSSPASVPLSKSLSDVFPKARFISDLPSITGAHDPRTDMPDALPSPPRYIALYNVGSVAVNISVVNLFDVAISKFTPLDSATLRCVCVSLNGNPPRQLFTSAWKGCVPDVNAVSIEFRHDTNDEDRCALQTRLRQLRDFVSDACKLPRHSIEIQPHTLLILDNRRFAYATTTTKNEQFCLERAAFTLENSPELDAALFSASRHPFYCENAPTKTPLDVLNLSKWPMKTKPELVRAAETHFANIGYGGSGLYFGPSGGSSTKSLVTNGGQVDKELLALCAMPPPFRGALPASLKEVNEIRLINRDLSIDVGLMRKDTVLANIMVSGIGGRSLEVVFHVFTDAHVTNFPVESRVSDKDLMDFVDHFGVTSLIGMSSRLIQFAIYCQRRNVHFESMKSVMYAGESFEYEQFNPVRKLNGASSKEKEVEIFASYGSSEVGEFSMRYADRESYMTYDDVMHVEFVDDDGVPVREGEVGRVVVTNLRRRNIPMVRFCQDDMGRFVPRTGEFEIMGRNRNQVYRVLGNVNLYWNDLVDTVGKYLIGEFDGSVLYQVWSHDGERGDHATDITLAVYALQYDDARMDEIEREALKKLDKLLVGSTVKSRNLKWLEDGELVRAHSHKLRTFVGPHHLEGLLF